MNEWFVIENGQSVGPMSLDALAAKLPSVGGPQAMVYGPGLANWTPAAQVPAVSARMSPGRGAPPLPPGVGRRADVIDYEIFGNEMQYVEVTLDPQEMAIAEPGGMMFMEPGIVMQTVFGDPSAQQKQGFFSKLATAGKRMITGESLFMSTFQNQAPGRQRVAFAAPYPGKIIPVHLDKHQGELICQKDSFLAAARGVQVAIAFQKKIGVALFGGEGFIMQRLTGDGIALLHAGGTIMERILQPGETLRVDTGCIVAMERSVQYDIQFTGGFKNSLFGGEGLFLATVSGPGKVWLQSLPFARLAGRVLANAAGGGKDEGSVLGNLGGFLGNSD